MKTDLSGNFLWMQVYGDGLQDEGFHCELDDDGGFLLPAFTTSYLLTDSTQMLVIKTDSNGVSGCHEKESFPFANAYSVITLNDTLSVQNINSIDTLVLQQISVTVNNDDACLFARVEETVTKNLSVYPVPANESLTIEYENFSGKYNIYSVFGNVVTSGKIANGKSYVYTGNLTNGIYIVELISDETKLTKNFCVLHQ
jgi:hypothetical protein